MKLEEDKNLIQWAVTVGGPACIPATLWDGSVQCLAPL